MDSTNSMTSNNNYDIKTKLALYGINFENYKDTTGNLVGVTKVPNAFLSVNPNIKIEDAFYLVANKVFVVCNLVAKDIPRQFIQHWKEVVGDKIYADFKYAVYEEINQRFLSNNFPEFSNATIYTPSNMNIQIGGNLGSAIVNPIDLLNPISREILNNIDWFSIDPNLQLDPNLNSSFLYSNFSNLDLPIAENKKVLGANEDGNFIPFNYDDFVKQEEINSAIEKINTNSNNLANLQSDFNEVRNTWQTENLATQDWVNKQIASFPETEIWTPDKTYRMPQFVVHNGGIYFCVQDNCLNKVPGGTSGVEWWTPITNIIQQSKDGEIVYKIGTDIKYSLVSPNDKWYVNLNDIKTCSSEQTLFTKLVELFPDLNLTLQDVNNFVTNFCGSIGNLRSYCNYLLQNSFTISDSINIPYAARNEVKFFMTESDANSWKSVNSVNASSSFLVGRYLRFGNNATGGSNYLTLANLPNNFFIPKFWRQDNNGTEYWDQLWINYPKTSLNTWMGLNTDNIGNIAAVNAVSVGHISTNQPLLFSWTNSTGSKMNAGNNDSVSLRAGQTFYMKLNDTSPVEFTPSYSNLWPIQVTSTKTLNRYISQTIQIRPSNFSCFVNVVNIQNYYRGNEILTDVSRMLQQYSLKVDVDRKLETKINVLDSDQNDHIVLVNDTGNLKSTNFTNVELDKINKIDEKLDINPDSWTSDMCNNIVNKLKQYWSNN